MNRPSTIAMTLGGGLLAGALITYGNVVANPRKDPRLAERVEAQALAGQAQGVSAPSAVVERYSCELATRLQLREPNSYQPISFEQASDDAALVFRSRDGSGGSTQGKAVCTNEGDGVRSSLVAQH
ncbi:hypothetical protein [Cyanobium sp. ATX 6F1]|nr:hypothetical protein [Cyanobium sp. ATX 6F1]MCP9917746.1 hypothetical protein [Cyanobium sp. ATX 6F1]